MTTQSVTTVSHHHIIVIIHLIHQLRHTVFISIHQPCIFFIDHKISETSHHEFWQKNNPFPTLRLFRLFEFLLGWKTLWTDSSTMMYESQLSWSFGIHYADVESSGSMILAQIHSRSFWINFSHEIIPKDCTYLYLQSSNRLDPPFNIHKPGRYRYGFRHPFGPSNLISHKRWGRHRMPKCPAGLHKRRTITQTTTHQMNSTRSSCQLVK